jgi:uncharacterized protein YqgV (UPF0045/DUF77 family)
VIAELQVAPSPPGTADDPHAHVEAAIAVIQASGLRYEVGALGTTLEGDDDQIWATLRAAHEAMLAAGATGGISHIKVASVNRTIDSLTHKFREPVAHPPRVVRHEPRAAWVPAWSPTRRERLPSTGASRCCWRWPCSCSSSTRR